MASDSVDGLKATMFEAQSKLVENALKLEFSRASTELAHMKGWQLMIERMNTVREGETRRLINQRLDDYLLGRVQGVLRTLALITTAEPLTADQLEEIEEDNRILTQTIADVNRLLQ